LQTGRSVPLWEGKKNAKRYPLNACGHESRLHEKRHGT
jgi:hypothetical protein